MATPTPPRGHGPAHAAPGGRRRLAWLLAAALLLVVVAAVVVVLVRGSGGSGDGAAAPAPLPSSDAPVRSVTAPPPAQAPPGPSPAVRQVALQADLDRATGGRPAMFRADSTTMTPAVEAWTGQVARALASTPGTIVVTGHTAAVDGDPALCQRISQQRADLVAGQLIRDGVDPARVQARGVSHSQALATWDASRRVTVAAG